jgi:3-phenylpropionate/trans-cinnamate dioxygenase ferredoxin reductase component
VIVRIKRVVIVGAGLAGLRTLEELRAKGYAGAVTLVGAEARPPYDRPPLSKGVLAGEADDSTLREDLSALGADVRLGEPATGVADGVLRTGRGEYSYDRLVLATGAVPVPLPGPGPQRLLRTLDDALRLRAALRPGLRLVIVGAGWIGAEVATVAAGAGCLVTVVEAGRAPLAAALGQAAGARTSAWYAAAGVSLRLGELVSSVQPGGLMLAGGEWLAAEEIVTAVGVRPQVRWLDGSGIALDNGVKTDEQLRTSAPGVFAAGDCAAFWSVRYRRRLRFEHWDIALRAPEVLAANLLGGNEVYDPVPYFWSEQFGRMVQYVGYHSDADRLIWRGDPAGDKFAACWLADGRLAALLTVGLPRDLQQGRRLVAAGLPVNASRIADPAIAVRDAVLR